MEGRALGQVRHFAALLFSPQWPARLASCGRPAGTGTSRPCRSGAAPSPACRGAVSPAGSIQAVAFDDHRVYPPRFSRHEVPDVYRSGRIADVLKSGRSFPVLEDDDVQRVLEGNAGRIARGLGLAAPDAGAVTVEQSPSYVDSVIETADFVARNARRRYAKPPVSKRVWPDDLPTVALEKFLVFVVIGRATLRECLDEAARSRRGIEKQDAAGFAATVLPGMRDVARHECAGARPANSYFVADFEGELPGEHPGNLITVTVQMIEARGTGGQGLLENHDALAGLAPEQLHCQGAAGCRGLTRLGIVGV